jgi:hypothetical protein
VAILPVWCEDWALGCCGDVNPATIGDRWEPSLVAYVPFHDPVETDLAPLGWSMIENGESILVGEMHLDPEMSPQQFIDLGSIKVAAKQGTEAIDGRFLTTTKVFYDWHADIERGLLDLVSVEGTVRDVVRYTPRYERRLHDQKLTLVGHETQVGVTTTRGWLRHAMSDALVLLDVETADGTRFGASPS